MVAPGIGLPVGIVQYGKIYKAAHTHVFGLRIGTVYRTRWCDAPDAQANRRP